MTNAKNQVHDFWNAAACGEDLYLSGADRAAYDNQARHRYRLEPYIESFAEFSSARNRDVLEIGVGLGADHQRFAQAGARLSGIDLTERAVIHTRHRMEIFDLRSRVETGDAENLAYPDESFDVVYSWGVLHHSPDTRAAVQEVWRVLRPGGIAKVMIYHKWSLVGYMLWLRYALFAGRPWRTLNHIYSKYLESPGTKAYSIQEARHLFGQFRRVRTDVVLSHGDLLTSDVGQRHRGLALTIAKRVWPRRLLEKLLPNHGLFLLITAEK